MKDIISCPLLRGLMIRFGLVPILLTLTTRVFRLMIRRMCLSVVLRVHAVFWLQNELGASPTTVTIKGRLLVKWRRLKASIETSSRSVRSLGNVCRRERSCGRFGLLLLRRRPLLRCPFRLLLGARYWPCSLSVIALLLDRCSV